MICSPQDGNRLVQNQLPSGSESVENRQPRPAKYQMREADQRADGQPQSDKGRRASSHFRVGTGKRSEHEPAEQSSESTADCAVPRPAK